MKTPEIPNLPAEALREIADRVAQEAGYRVRVPVTVLLDRSAMLVTFRASDGLSFPGSVSAHDVARVLASAKGGVA